MFTAIQLQGKSIRIGHFTHQTKPTLCSVRSSHLRSSIGIFQFLRELMHAHFERQMTSQVVSAPTAITTKIEIDSPLAEKSVSAPQHDSAAAVADA